MTRALPLIKRSLRNPARVAVRTWEIVTGLIYVSKPVQALFRYGRRRETPFPLLRTALLAHVYYPDLWHEIITCWRRLPDGTPLIITAPPPQADIVRGLAAGDPLIKIVPHINRGRDIAPTLAVLNSGQLDGYDAVLKLHTKRSPHLVLGDLRRRVLYAGLAGDVGLVSRVLGLFINDAVGLVGMTTFWRQHARWWLANRKNVTALADAMSAPVDLGFFEGSMFWFRPSALRPLRDLQLPLEVFEAEAGQTDGTMHHAVERAFTLAVLATDRRICSTRGVVLMAAKPRA